MGASLLVFLNKTDVEQCMSEEEVREVSVHRLFCASLYRRNWTDECHSAWA